MLEQRQVQVILELLTGRERVPVPAGALDEPWRTIYTRLEAPEPGAPWDREAAHLAIWKATRGLDDRQGCYETIAHSLPSPDAYRQFRSMADLAAELPPVEWLWPGWIPRGLLSLLGAAPGAGKSLVALDLAGRIINGDAFPDGASTRGGEAPPCAGSNVVYVDAEAVPQIQNQRAAAWGMDRSRLWPMLPVALSAVARRRSLPAPVAPSPRAAPPRPAPVCCPLPRRCPVWSLGVSCELRAPRRPPGPFVAVPCRVG